MGYETGIVALLLVLSTVGLIYIITFIWNIFCVGRGYKKLNQEQKEKFYSYDELHALGNPFCKYKGRSNW